jgi:hypothetical protein
MFSADGRCVIACTNLAKLFPRHELPRPAQEALAASPAGIFTKATACPCHRSEGGRTVQTPLPSR